MTKASIKKLTKKAVELREGLSFTQQRMFDRLFSMTAPCTTAEDIREHFHCTKASAVMVSSAYDEFWDYRKSVLAESPPHG